MKTPLPPDKALEHYRAGYLKMKSVLYDRTTGLPAFPILFDRLRTLLDRRRQIGVVHLEIANLEMVESLYGWQVFDGIVSRVAALLRDCVGQELPSGALLAINGVAGGRFVAFVPDRPDGTEPDTPYLAETGRSICRKLESAFDEETFAGLNPGLCVRAGQALLSENPFYRFERCVYAAVEEARALHDRRERRRDLTWGEELRRIIRNRAVNMVFQPVVELRTRDVVGHEALARGPRDTMFEAPRAMFELSSRLGMAAQLDQLCCEEAFGASVELGDRKKLFVNVLQDNVDEDAWRGPRLHSLLEQSGLQPADLVLELSERGVGSDPEPLIARLERIKQEGFAVALDDVGTGRVGLEAIERVRPDYLKLDASLVRDIDASLVQQEVLTTLAGVVDRIGAAVIAEGVETELEAARLTEGGARYAQGHLFALPAPAATFRSGAGRNGPDH